MPASDRPSEQSHQQRTRFASVAAGTPVGRSVLDAAGFVVSFDIVCKDFVALAKKASISSPPLGSLRGSGTICAKRHEEHSSLR